MSSGWAAPYRANRTLATVGTWPPGRTPDEPLAVGDMLVQIQAHACAGEAAIVILRVPTFFKGPTPRLREGAGRLSAREARWLGRVLTEAGDLLDSIELPDGVARLPAPDVAPPLPVPEPAALRLRLPRHRKPLDLLSILRDCPPEVRAWARARLLHLVAHATRGRTIAPEDVIWWVTPTTVRGMVDELLARAGYDPVTRPQPIRAKENSVSCPTSSPRPGITRPAPTTSPEAPGPSGATSTSTGRRSS